MNESELNAVLTERQAQLEQRKQALAAAQEQVNEIAQEIFRLKSQSFFDRYPALQSFGWDQYTQFWNDGDICEFNVYNYADSISVNGHREWDLDEDDEEFDASLKPIFDELESFLQSIDDDYYESTFGDHVSVTVDRNGVTVEDCTDHD